MKPERWFYLDRFEANEFCPLWRWLDRFWVCIYGLPNWCHVSIDEDGLVTIRVPHGDFFPEALEQVERAIE